MHLLEFRHHTQLLATQVVQSLATTQLSFSVANGGIEDSSHNPSTSCHRLPMDVPKSSDAPNNRPLLSHGWPNVVVLGKVVVAAPTASEMLVLTCGATSKRGKANRRFAT